MIEPGEKLPLPEEMPQHRVCVGAALDQLDRDLFLVLIVGPIGQENCPHAAASNLPTNAIAVNDLAGRQAFRLETLAGEEAIELREESAPISLRLQERLHLAVQLIVVNGFQKFRSLGNAELESLLKESLDFLPPLAGQAAFRVSTRCVLVVGHFSVWGNFIALSHGSSRFDHDTVAAERARKFCCYPAFDQLSAL